MIDIHNHLIYDVDDGSPDLETSLAMARDAAADGVKRIVCTPHAKNTMPYHAEIVNERFAELRSLLRNEIELSLGCDFHMSPENVKEACENPLRYSIDGKGYLLIEFANYVIPPEMDAAIRSLQSVGYRLIVTHPERYPIVQVEPDRIANWMRVGCFIQVTAGALYGRFGPAAEALSNELLRRQWIHFIATDAHHPLRRPPNMKRAYDFISARHGEETAQRLCVTNPQAAVEGIPLPAQPEPLGLQSGEPLRFRIGKSSGEGKRFWQRLFGKSKSEGS
jgi:protein-tyrosine phosphatase